MAEARKLTFEQTFAKCAIPQGVLSALGPCPAEVRLNKAARSMLVSYTHLDVYKRQYLGYPALGRQYFAGY